ncbi:MAG TPA: hypothetical protein VHX87_12315 [Galbitalea sp.]|jgi:hypothetical protein|nr:hypothetical protein [Galbitalea sp.]
MKHARLAYVYFAVAVSTSLVGVVLLAVGIFTRGTLANVFVVIAIALIAANAVALRIYGAVSRPKGNRRTSRPNDSKGSEDS